MFRYFISTSPRPDRSDRRIADRQRPGFRSEGNRVLDLEGTVARSGARRTNIATCRCEQPERSGDQEWRRGGTWRSALKVHQPETDRGDDWPDRMMVATRVQRRADDMVRLPRTSVPPRESGSPW